jgi:ectoine hydroxylase-related dioxygenase (phytanoyl-CoA dioxygenase family)
MQSMANQARERYERDGFVVFRNVLDQELMEEAKMHVDWLLRKHPDLRPEQLHTALVREDPFWVRLVGDDRLLDIAEMFIGPNIALFASHYICKPPSDGQAVLWHQDGAFWPLKPMNVITLWLAVDDSVPENGCLRVIPGTHRIDLQQYRKRNDVPNVLEYEIDPEFVDESKAVDVVLKSGDVSIHHPNIIHGSNANHSTMRRCGLTIRYIPTDTEITDNSPDKSSAFLLRGQAKPGINQYLPFPKWDKDKHFPFRGCEAWT